ncbi:D-glycero-beta-D-manno-heptose-7-phosphate kinase [bacterium AH-315-J21]|nr:D-glycero-beta-D-manno-heptose-7-phosphate kinase [bacterium AH-315-J21]
MRLSQSRIQAITEQMGSARILVLGDIMIDRYLYGTVSRISPEAPVPVVDIQRETIALGGAANVAANIAALGDVPLLVSVIGADSSADTFRQALANSEIASDMLIVDSSRQTTMKTRVIGESQQIVRADREDRHEISDEIQEQVLKLVSSKLDSVKALIISDYGKGVLTKSLLKEVITLANSKGIFIAVDPKETHFMNYSNVSVITPNHHEASFAIGKRILNEEVLLEVGSELMTRLRLKSLLITRGKDGMTLFEAEGSGSAHSNTNFPTVARRVFDVTGAGDTVIASFVSAVSAGATLKEATIISNCAAGITIGELGAATVSREAIADELQRLGASAD